MIAIIGQTHDDILYFINKMSLAKESQLYGDISCFEGTFSKESAVVVATGSTNYLSAMITSLIIKLYHPYLVINVGTVSSLANQLKQGDIFVADRYYFTDVDFSLPKFASLGQIPGQNEFFVADNALNLKMENAAYLATFRYIQNGYLLSGEKFIMDKGEIEKLLKERYGGDKSFLAYDNASAGVCLACHIAGTQLVTVKAVSYNIGNPTQAVTFIRQGLEVEPTIGKIVTGLILSMKGD